MASFPSSPDPTSAPSRPADSADHSDLDPAAFLKSVRELSEKREREDAERFRKLEEEVEKSRQARAARRAERARSISPQKPLQSLPSSTTSRPLSHVDFSTPPRMSPPADSTNSTPSVSKEVDADTDRAGAGVEEVPEFKGFGSKRSSAASTSSSLQTKDTSQSPSQPSATTLARSGTLSWQQRRPNPRVGGSRPVSMVEPVKAMANSGPEPTREQISAQLSARDPSWFRQTPDRGAGSAAYRKSKDEVTMNDNASVASSRRGLPGMSRETSIDPSEGYESPRAPESNLSEIPSRINSARESIVSSTSRFSATSTTSSDKPDLKSLIAADEGQQRASPAFEQGATDDPGSASGAPAMSNSQARLAGLGGRPASPTKGMGGFVQSALLKRSDSVSKRGSNPAGASSSRPESLASQRSGRTVAQTSPSMPKLEPTVGTTSTPVGDESDPKRISSSSNDLPSLQNKPDDETFVKPALPSHSRSRSVVSNHSVSDDTHVPQTPGSPSKRWSPNKSSWIESALQKPESPKLPATKNSQPSWMANLAKAKAERASTDSTPKPANDAAPRPDSPTKTAPFGQGMLKRSSTKDLSSSPAIEPTKSTKIAEKPPPVAHTSTKPAVKTTPQTSAQAETITKLTGPADEEPKAVQMTPTSAQAEPLALDINKIGADAGANKTEVPPTAPKPKPDAATKPQTDFRASLRPRAPTQSAPKEEPEFLSKVTALRKTQQERYVAPDLLKNNILRGKAGLSLTGGPVKSERKDEFKESLNAKKVEIKKAKEEGRDLPGQVHERKTSETRKPPAKPEALTRRETLHRSESAKAVPTQAQSATPEALARHKSIRQKPAPEKPEPETSTPAPAANFEHLEKQISAPAVVETSKLASRFNPGLAGLLARGPPVVSSGPLRSDGASLARSTSSDPPTESGPLQDMRKDRAKGPKRRKGGNTTKSTSDPVADELDSAKDLPTIPNQPSASRPLVAPKSTTPLMTGSLNQSYRADNGVKEVKQSRPETEEVVTTPKPKPQALPGSAASIMRASLRNADILQTPSSESAKIAPSPKPSTIAKSPMLPSKPVTTLDQTDKPAFAKSESPVPEFRGFGASKPAAPMPKPGENKENDTNAALPSVRSAATMWGRRPSPQKNEAPAQIQLSTKRDEEAANKPTGITVEKSRNLESKSQSSPGLPPKPGKSSRVVSGQLAEASPNQDSPPYEEPETEAGKLVLSTFGRITKSPPSLAIDTQAIIAACGQQQIGEDVRSIRKNVQLVLANGSTEQMPPQEEYTLFGESVYLCTHHFHNANGLKITRVFVWAGNTAGESTVEAATTSARRAARENGGAPSHTVRQGQESSALLQALGGILVTRRGSRANASKQYMLCGRKHLSHIVFDEVDFAPNSLCAGFVFLISFPVTLTETRLYLWKGAACSTEELSAARLAAMDLSETGEIIEVDGGAEFPSFLKIFGPDHKPGSPTSSAIAAVPSGLWAQKARHPNRFATRMFRVQQAEPRASLMNSLWSRRPTWNAGAASSSPSASPSAARPAANPEEFRAEAKALPAFSPQVSLDAEGIYLLDAYFRIYLLVGPLAARQEQQHRPANASTSLFAQALLFASDYAILATSMEDRPGIPTCEVVFSGAPGELKWLFRQWDEGQGLWGTAGLMTGRVREAGKELRVVGLEEVIREVIVRG